MSPSEGGRRRLHVHAIIDSLVWGGAELLLADFAAAAREAAMDVTVAYLHHEEPSPGLDKLRAHGVEPTLIEIPRMVNPRAHRMVLRNVAEVAPDIVHTHLGYAHALPEEGGKKIYEITDEGRKHLAENQPLIDDIFSKIADFAQNIFGEPMMEVHRGFKNVGRAVYASAKSSARTPDQIRKIKEILERAATEIDAV